MPTFPTLVSLWRTLFRSARLDHDLDAELRTFVDTRTEQHIARGLAPDEARRAALVEMGGIEQVKEHVRQRRVGRGLETLWRDLRYGCRSLARTPTFATVVVLTLALVIGANAAVFSAMHAVLWRALPYPDAGRLVLVDADARGLRDVGLSDAERTDLRAEPGLFDLLGVIHRVDASIATDDEMEQVMAARASDDVLLAFGAWPMLHGRLFDTVRDIDADGYPRSIIVSHDLWQRRLGGDPAAVGRHVDVNNREVEVVGVLRPDVRIILPAGNALPEVAGIWFPKEFEDNRRHRSPGTIARLASGVSGDAAQARLDAIAQRLTADHEAAYADGPVRLYVMPLHDAVTADARPAMWALAGAVGFVLLVGCVNIGNLMLARARTRGPEMAVRRALGAGRVRLVRQLLTETAVLAVLGGVAGLFVAHVGVGLIDWLRPMHLPRQSEIAVNGTVVLFTAGLSMVTSLLFGLLPAVADATPASEVLGFGRANVQRAGARRLQRALVVAEVALCIIPLVAGGLMLRTFVNLANAPIGFDPDGVLTAKVPLSLRSFPDEQRRRHLFATAIDEVRRLPGVRAASVGGPLPFVPSPFMQAYGPADVDAPLTSRASVQSALPGYLAVMGVQLEAGRDFTMDDLVAERRVVVVDQRIARQLWPDGAIGQRLAVGQHPSPQVFEVIGVTRPVRTTRVRDTTMPHLFFPYDRFGFVMSLVVQTDEPAAAIGPAIKQAVEALGTRRPVHDILPMRTYVDRSMGDTRFTMLVIVGFAAAALLLAAVGVYGTLAYLTAQRRQEFGVRMALGASTRRVLLSVVGDGLLMTAVGAALGLGGAMLTSALLRDLLYEVSPFDLPTLAAVAGIVVIVALAATAHPAIRAARTDPATVLRAE